MESFVTENKKSDVEILHDDVMETIEETKKKKCDCDVDINMTKGYKHLKSNNVDKIYLMTERTCAEDDETWDIDDGTDSDGDTIGDGIKVFSSLSDALKENDLAKLKTERKMLTAIRKSPNSSSSDTFKTSFINKELINQEKELHFTSVENKQLQDSMDTYIENSVQEMSPCLPCSDTFMQELSSLFEKEKQALAAVKESPNSNSDSFKTFPNYKEIAKQEMLKQGIIEQEIIKQELKKKKHLQDTEKLKCKKVNNKVDQNSIDINQLILKLENEVRSELEKDDVFYKTINDQGSHEIDVNPLDCFGQSDLQPYWTNVPSNSTDLHNPSCSTSLPGSSNFSKLPCSFNSPTSIDENSILSSKLDTKSLLNFYDKVYLNDLSSLKEMAEENIEVLPLEECILTKELSKHLSLDNSDVDSETEYTDSFVEDPDIVNPDILYNINLNEYYTQMELLVQKISETPEDQTVFAECMQLPPIPENEHEPQTFTEKERYNFENGISEYEYEIDSEDWNKIMVKRAVAFTAHAGFTIANEESLYVLADVAIDYIKKLAVIMKNNFDIQENSSYPDCIDPISNSLLQIGVEGGIAELIRHYENDVFGRRDKLIKKCQHLQKIIDQYTERMLALNTKTQNSSKDDFVRENPTNERVMVHDEIKLKDEKTEMETIMDEVQTEILSTIEEVEVETQSISSENMLLNIKVKQTEPFCIDNADCETNENNESEPVDNCDLKIDYDEIMNSKLMDVDISKHSGVKPDCTSLKDMCSKDLTSSGTTDLEYSFLKCSDRSNSSSSTKKNKKLLDFATVKKWLEQFYPQEAEPESEPDPAEEARIIRERLKEHATEFSELVDRYASYNNSVSTDSDDNLADNNLIPPQTVIVNQKSDKNEASSLNTNNTIQNIPTPVVVNKNDNCDYKILCRYISLNSTSSNN